MEPHNKRARINHGPAATTAVAAAVVVAPPHTRLHRHALESIFAFLSFREIRLVMFVSRDWLAAVYSMRGVGHTIWDASKLQGGLPSVLQSRLSRHVDSLDCDTLPVTPPLLRQICAAMPYLRSLDCTPSHTEEWRGPLPLPSELTSLRMELADRMDDDRVNDLLTSVSSHTRLQHLSMRWNGAPSETDRPQQGPRVNFAPLTHTFQLRTLTHWGISDLTDEQVSQLRFLTQLSQLDLAPCPPDLLSRLLAPGHRLGWTQLSPQMQLDDVAASLLGGLAHLSNLLLKCHHVMNLTSFDFLPSLPQLTRLEMVLHYVQPNLQRTLLTLPLPLPALTCFVLHGSNLTSAQLGTLLSRMPKLESLTLHSMHQLESLAFLRAEPLRSTLRSLGLFFCSHADLLPSQLAHLHGMRLTELILQRSLTLDEAQRAMYTPPSAVLPQLTRFYYFFQ